MTTQSDMPLIYAEALEHKTSVYPCSAQLYYMQALLDLWGFL